MIFIEWTYQWKIFFSIVYQRLQQPITSKDRADLDSILQMTLQVISGVVHIKINELRRGKLKEFVKWVVKITSEICHFTYNNTREYKATVEPLQKALVDKQSPEKVQIMQCCLVGII